MPCQEEAPEQALMMEVIANGSIHAAKDSQTPQTVIHVKAKRYQQQDRGWAWLVLFASFMVNFIIDAVSFSFGLFYIEFLDYFRQSKSKTALVGSVLNGAYLSMGPFTSLMIGALGCRPVAMLGSVIAASGFFFCTFSPNINILILTFGGLGGIGFGLLYLPAMVIIGQYFHKRYALATGIALSGSGIGLFAFAPVWELLISKYSWKGAAWVVSGIVLNGLVIGAIYRPFPTQTNAKKENNNGDRYQEANPAEPEAEILLDNRNRYQEANPAEPEAEILLKKKKVPTATLR